MNSATGRKPCSSDCKLGLIVRAQGLGSRPRPRKRQWQLFAAGFLLIFSYGFYLEISRNATPHGVVALLVIAFFGCCLFLYSLLAAAVGLGGCDDCVSRM
jgi:hypothetical protein